MRGRRSVEAEEAEWLCALGGAVSRCFGMLARTGHRFLSNHRLDPRGVTDGLVRVIFGRRGKGFWPILFDQTKSGATQALVAGVPFEGRTLPLAAYTFS
jgi:hypothetical protein